MECVQIISSRCLTNIRIAQRESWRCFMAQSSDSLISHSHWAACLPRSSTQCVTTMTFAVNTPNKALN